MYNQQSKDVENNQILREAAACKYFYEYVCLQIDCPEFPEDLKHWISFISASSQALRAESGLEDKSK